MLFDIYYNFIGPHRQPWVLAAFVYIALLTTASGTVQCIMAGLSTELVLFSFGLSVFLWGFGLPFIFWTIDGRPHFPKEPE